MQVRLLEVDVNLVDHVVAAEDVVRAAVVIGLVFQRAPAADVEEIDVITVLVAQRAAVGGEDSQVARIDAEHALVQETPPHRGRRTHQRRRRCRGGGA